MNNRAQSEAKPAPVYPGDGWNEDADRIRRHFVADVLSAKSAQRTALAMRSRGMPADFVSQARAVRDASLRGARHQLMRYRAAIAKATGSAS
jgi:hypothetical protein